MRRAKLPLAAALLLAYYAVGPAATVNLVANGQFNEELAGTWETWAGDCGDFTNAYPGAPTYTTVDIVKGRNTTNPALTWYRWDHDLIYPAALAVGAQQQIGGTSGQDTAGRDVVFKADITLMMQNWVNSGWPDWYPGLMGVKYSYGGNSLFEVKRFRIGTDPSPDQIPLNETRTVTWDLTSFFGDRPGSRITGVFFGGQGDSFQAQADNVELDVSPVPEPGGILALAGALSGAMVFLRRRR
ncbi:MAG: PEP-CTERM sorting domain-containing protein [Armatimonadota bacterium]|nr:PEP-CTERM sorting domain-containing protein [Armatimonadota bacterium]